jgi:hypothetical protein
LQKSNSSLEIEIFSSILCNKSSNIGSQII